MTKRPVDVAHTPLRPADLFILLVLSEQDLHGYGVMKAVQHLSDGAVRVEIGSLYRLIARMIGEGLMTEVPAASAAARPEPDDDRRRYYRITPLGRRTLKTELSRLKSVVGLAAAKRVFDDRGRSR